MKDLPERVAEAERQVEKTHLVPQKGGSDVTKAYRNRRENVTWDWDRTSSGWVSGQLEEHHDIFVKFTSSDQVAPQAVLVITCLVNNSYYYITPNGQTSYNGAVNNVWFNGTYFDVFGSYSPDKPIPNTPYEVSWYDHIAFTAQGVNVKLKFDVYSTAKGTLKIKMGNTLI